MRDCGTKIVSVALLYKPTKIDKNCPEFGPVIISATAPARHADIIHTLSAMSVSASVMAEQGFLTDTGQFLSRGAAKAFVFDVGQTTIRDTNPHELFSEDLW